MRIIVLLVVLTGLFCVSGGIKAFECGESAARLKLDPIETELNVIILRKLNYKKIIQNSSSKYGSSVKEITFDKLGRVQMIDSVSDGLKFNFEYFYKDSNRLPYRMTKSDISKSGRLQVNKEILYGRDKNGYVTKITSLSGGEVSEEKWSYEYDNEDIVSVTDENFGYKTIFKGGRVVGEERDGYSISCGFHYGTNGTKTVMAYATGKLNHVEFSRYSNDDRLILNGSIDLPSLKFYPATGVHASHESIYDSTVGSEVKFRYKVVAFDPKGELVVSEFGKFRDNVYRDLISESRTDLAEVDFEGLSFVKSLRRDVCSNDSHGNWIKCERCVMKKENSFERECTTFDRTITYAE